METFYVHPTAAAAIRRAAQSNERSVEEMSADEARALLDPRVADSPLPRPDLHDVRDMTIPGPAGDLAIRIYRPRSDPALPFCMYFHGGGFMLGNLETHDALCRILSAGSGAAIVAVEFRLSPENRFPTAHDDCAAATRWAVDNAADLGFDPNAFALAGESSGGNIAASTSFRLARDGLRPRLQVLLYPLVDMTLTGESYETFAEGYLLTTRKMAHYVQAYLDGGDPRSVIASPLRHAVFTDAPPTFLLTASLDPTVSDARLFGQKLLGSGVSVEFHELAGWPHGFLFWGDPDGSLPALALASSAIRRALAG